MSPPRAVTRPAAGSGGAACDVFDMRVETAVFMHHQDSGERPVTRRLHQIAAHFPGIAAGGIIGDVARGHAAVGERDHLGFRVARQQRLSHGKRGHAANDSHGSGTAQKFAALHAAVAILVVQIVNFRINIRRCNFGVVGL